MALSPLTTENSTESRCPLSWAGAEDWDATWVGPRIPSQIKGSSQTDHRWSWPSAPVCGEPGGGNAPQQGKVLRWCPSPLHRLPVAATPTCHKPPGFPGYQRRVLSQLWGPEAHNQGGFRPPTLMAALDLCLHHPRLCPVATWPLSCVSPRRTLVIGSQAHLDNQDDLISRP